LGKILSIPYQGLSLNDTEMNDNEVFAKIYLPRQGPPLANNKLQSISRLIARI